MRVRELSHIEVLTALHAGDGAVVTFHTKAENGAFVDVASLPVCDLREKLPFVAGHLQRNSYFSINSTYQQRHSRESAFGFQVYSRRERNLKWLNAVALDLDAGHGVEGFSVATLREQFLAEIESDSLPVPSLLCESGRGMWALWLLRDHRDGGPVPAHDRCRQWHKRIGQAVARRFAHLGADVRCHDCARIMRFPGSLNTSAPAGSQAVRFFRLSDSVYTLPELGPHFGIRPRKTSIAPRKGPRDAAKQAGGYARWSNVLRGFRQLWAIRGGFSKGHRHNAVYLLAALMRYNRQSSDVILRECSKLAESCKPPVAPDEVQKRIAAAAKVRARLRNDTFIRMLGITAEEVKQLPVWFKPPQQKAQQRVQNRRDALAEAIRKADRVFTVRESILVLRARGFKASIGTVASDLRSIGVQKSMLDRKTPLSKFKHEKLNTPKVTHFPVLQGDRAATEVTA